MYQHLCMFRLLNFNLKKKEKNEKKNIQKVYIRCRFCFLVRWFVSFLGNLYLFEFEIYEDKGDIYADGWVSGIIDGVNECCWRYFYLSPFFVHHLCWMCTVLLLAVDAFTLPIGLFVLDGGRSCKEQETLLRQS